MKITNLFRTGLLTIAVSIFLITACDKEPSDLAPISGDVESAKSLKAGNNGTASYIVVLNEDFEAAGELAGKHDYDQRKQVMSGYLNRFLGGKGIGNDQVEQVYTNVFMGFAARLSGPQSEKLRQDTRVKSIEPDQEITLGKPGGGGGTQPAEVTPWGITRVGGGISGATGKAWIIDSGIDLTHPDLSVDVPNSRYFIGRSPQDENGHGTHVAGIIAAKDNTIGVIGVAAGATVVAVRVLDRRGSGTISSVIGGCDYVKANGVSGDVANMSLGGGVSTALDDAVKSMSIKVMVALAAGNESDNANNHSPARVNGSNIYTVSAMGTLDNWASFSNFGNPPIDYCAPGVSIYSCYKGGTYATMSGTSMAAPHVAGLLLLGAITTNGYVSGDPDGNADPIAHR
ncbi:MAG: S8 family serine peptidase [Bacteroidales bacterium]